MKLDKRIIAKLFLVVGLLMVCLAVADVAAASEGSDLPWNSGLEKLTNALSGKTALFISMIGIFFAGGMLIFGGDLGNFGKSVMMVVLVGSMLGALANVANAFISTGALLA